MKWTEGVPAEAGYYWFKYKDDFQSPFIAKVAFEYGCQMYAYECGSEIDFSCFENYLHYGPLQVPEVIVCATNLIEAANCEQQA